MTVYEPLEEAFQIIVSESVRECKGLTNIGCILRVHDRSNKVSIPSVGCWVEKLGDSHVGKITCRYSERPQILMSVDPRVRH